MPGPRDAARTRCPAADAARMHIDGTREDARTRCPVPDAARMHIDRRYAQRPASRRRRIARRPCDSSRRDRLPRRAIHSSCITREVSIGESVRVAAGEPGRRRGRHWLPRGGPLAWRMRATRPDASGMLRHRHNWTRGVAAQHASLSRWRSPVRIRSGPPQSLLPTPRPPARTGRSSSRTRARWPCRRLAESVP